MTASYNFVTHDGLNYTVEQIALKVKQLYVAKADEKTKLSDFTNDANYVTDASYVHTDNNYTTDEKTKLSGIATGAQVNVIESVKVNGTALTVDQNKAVDITMPTALSDLTDDLGHQANVIETVKVNGSALTPDANKAVDVTVPTAVSDLTNDSNFEENVIETINVDGSPLTVTNKAVSITLPTVPTTVSSFTNDAGYQTASDVATAINTQVAAAYKAAGSVAFASLPSPAAANSGKVYNITDNFTITSDFVEYDSSNPKSYPAGTNVALVEAVAASGNDPAVYKYDVMSGFVDLSGYIASSDVATVTNSQIDDIVDGAFSDEEESGS